MNFFGGTIAINGFSMVLLPLNHHHWMFFHWLTIAIDGFQWFPQILVRWSTMVLAHLKDLKKLAIATYPIFWQILLMIEKVEKWIPHIISELPGHFADWRHNQNSLDFEDYILLPLQNFNGFERHHHHWMEWLGATIGFNGFSMVLGSGNHWFRWFLMVVYHWSDDGMVTYHRWSLHQGHISQVG